MKKHAKTSEQIAREVVAIQVRLISKGITYPRCFEQWVPFGVAGAEIKKGIKDFQDQYYEGERFAEIISKQNKEIEKCDTQITGANEILGEIQRILDHNHSLEGCWAQEDFADIEGWLGRLRSVLEAKKNE